MELVSFEGGEKFDAPPYTVLSREVTSNGITITTVVVDGVVEVFEIPVHVYDQYAAKADFSSRQAEEIISRVYDISDDAVNPEDTN